VRRFWVATVSLAADRAAFGKALGSPCVTNVWIPDGFKDPPSTQDGPVCSSNGRWTKIFAES